MASGNTAPTKSTAPPPRLPVSRGTSKETLPNQNQNSPKVKTNEAHPTKPGKFYENHQVNYKNVQPKVDTT
jgi:hypothetical protein